MDGKNLKRVLEIGDKWIKDVYKISDVDKKNLIDLYFEATKIKKNGCSSCYGTMYRYFKNQKPKQMENTQKKSGEFSLKAGKLVYFNGKHYTADSITDEVAKELLKEHPNHIANFSNYPDNWKQMCSVIESKKEDDENVGVAETVNQIEARKSLKDKKLLDLQAVASNMELPEDEWINIKVKSLLINYIVKNTK